MDAFVAHWLDLSNGVRTSKYQSRTEGTGSSQQAAASTDPMEEKQVPMTPPASACTAPSRKKRIKPPLPVEIRATSRQQIQQLKRTLRQRANSVGSSGSSSGGRYSPEPAAQPATAWSQYIPPEERVNLGGEAKHRREKEYYAWVEKCGRCLPAPNVAAVKPTRAMTHHTGKALPVLDFSFCDLKHMSTLIRVKPRTGKKREIASNSDSEEDEHQSDLDERYFSMDSLSHNALSKTFSVTELIADVGPMERPTQYHATALKLDNNGLNDVEGLTKHVSMVVFHCFTTLTSIDLSFNGITDLTNQWDRLKSLNTLLLHSNKIASFSEISKLSGLRRSLTCLALHGNENVVGEPNYKYKVLYQFPKLRSLDFSHVLSTEREDAILLAKRPVSAPAPFRYSVGPLRSPSPTSQSSSPTKTPTKKGGKGR